MSKLLEEAFAILAELPESDQDSIVNWLLEELDSEGRWKKLFSGSHHALGSLADEALSEHKLGRTKELDPDQL